MYKWILYGLRFRCSNTNISGCFFSVCMDVCVWYDYCCCFVCLLLYIIQLLHLLQEISFIYLFVGCCCYFCKCEDSFSFLFSTSSLIICSSYSDFSYIYSDCVAWSCFSSCLCVFVSVWLCMCVCIYGFQNSVIFHFNHPNHILFCFVFTLKLNDLTIIRKSFSQFFLSSDFILLASSHLSAYLSWELILCIFLFRFFNLCICVSMCLLLLHHFS